MSGPNEVLEPRLAKSEALPLIRSAQRHWKTARRSTLLLCAELRQLQDGQAHHTYGYSNFATFCVEKITPELSESSIKQFAWMGAPLMALERHGRLSLTDRAQLPVGTTGAAALAKLLNEHGEDALLEVFDLARSLKPGSPLSDVTVKRAQRELLPKPPPLELAEPEPDDHAYVSDADEAYDPTELPGELDQTLEVLDDLIAAVRDAETTPEVRQASLRRISVLHTRLDSLAQTLSDPAT